eukprot:gnl/TRDRNA2_/TRDRNA2_92867_c0_seq2.p1 gnl/TRDRNA2_/TRDRNA2_92867_c0~~gnl/TRDRNA2_/TRDRNA2_92867_c0_seq2.p1  ORF type:complete len:368 (-),score=42.17 gnl/TRDRNA2_/TRDRNA2_92867_c0_seq2:81-1124(-)
MSFSLLSRAGAVAPGQSHATGLYPAASSPRFVSAASSSQMPTVQTVVMPTVATPRFISASASQMPAVQTVAMPPVQTVATPRFVSTSASHSPRFVTAPVTEVVPRHFESVPPTYAAPSPMVGSASPVAVHREIPTLVHHFDAVPPTYGGASPMMPPPSPVAVHRVLAQPSPVALHREVAASFHIPHPVVHSVQYLHAPDPHLQSIHLGSRRISREEMIECGRLVEAPSNTYINAPQAALASDLDLSLSAPPRPMRMESHVMDLPHVQITPRSASPVRMKYDNDHTMWPTDNGPSMPPPDPFLPPPEPVEDPFVPPPKPSPPPPEKKQWESRKYDNNLVTLFSDTLGF